MKIPLHDLAAQYEPIREEVRAAIERVLDSQQFVLGPEVQALEEEIAKYSQTKFAIGCASGSDALLLALMSCGAYGAVQAGTYNTRALVPEVLVRDAEWALVRPRLEVDALIGLDRLPPWI